MFNIPNKFIVSSRLSTLDSQDILRILQVTQSNWDEKILARRMRQYPQIPIICIGISNPQELDRVVNDNIPIIHIQDTCIALQRVQERQGNFMHYVNCLLWMGTSSAWFLVGYTARKTKIFEENSRMMLGISGGVICLSLWTYYVVLRMRRHYLFLKEKGRVILMRKDILRSRHTLIQILMPLWALIGYSFEKLQ
ncbi:hypothetical protein BY458DRAFT_514000 [Sporodiniella umbellata]|nr:hypothetical protein BY458DRAFT_514000 [Sporodiniella umbellata]